MSTKAYFSNRIYKNTLSNSVVGAIRDCLSCFNRAKQFVLNTLVKEKRSGQSRREKSIHVNVKEKYQLDDYYANSAVQAAKAQLKSLDELKKIYIENKSAQIRSIKRKLKQERSRLTTLRKIKTSFIKDKPKFPKHAREQKQGNYFVVSYKKKTDIYYHAYQFEHTYLDSTIQQRKTRIGFLTSRLNRKEEELKQLRTKYSISCRPDHICCRRLSDHRIVYHDCVFYREGKIPGQGNRYDYDGGKRVFGIRDPSWAVNW